MKMLVANLWRFLLRVFSALFNILRGRTIALPPNSEADENIALLPSVSEPWLSKIRYIFVRVVHVKIGRKRRLAQWLVIDLPGLLDKHRFKDLHVFLFLKGQARSIGYSVDANNIRIYSSHTLALLLKPLSTVNAMIAITKTDEEQGYAMNVERIDLVAGNERRSFFYDGTGYFEPKAAKVANS